MKNEYPFSEFSDHFQAMLQVRDYEYVSQGNDPVEIGTEQGFEVNFLRVMDYMQQLYGDTAAARVKGKYLILIMSYLADHLADFDTKDYLVSGSNDSPALVSRHLLKAVHDIFTTTPLSDLGHGPSPESVMALADKFKS